LKGDVGLRRERFEIELEVLKQAERRNITQIMLHADLKHSVTRDVIQKFMDLHLIQIEVRNGHIYYIRTQAGIELLNQVNGVKKVLQCV
jgi:predicted transcriptional regulator